MEPPAIYTILLTSLVIGGVIVVAVRVLQINRAKAVRQERIVSGLLRHHTDMVVITDVGGLIMSASDRFNEALGRGSSDKPAVSFSELFQRGHSQSYEKILKYLDREKKPLIDHKVQLTWGSLDRELDMTIVPLLDSPEHIFALIHILRPTRDRGEVASDLGHIEKLTNIGQIAAGMAHELNTPLGSIILATDIIAEQLPEASAISEEIDIIRAQADHCSKVVGQLLSYVRKDEHTRSVQNVKQVIENIMELVAPEVIKQEITLALLGNKETDYASEYLVPETEASVYKKPGGEFGELFDKYSCISCHSIDKYGGTVSTVPLTIEGSIVQFDWLKNYLLRPYALRPILTERMPHFRMTDREASLMAEYITRVYVSDEIPRFFEYELKPTDIAAGRHLVDSLQCVNCHIINGKGGYLGPPLDNGGNRLQAGWVYSWMLHPHKYRPKTIQPDFGLTETEAREITAYLMTMKEDRK